LAYAWEGMSSFSHRLRTLAPRQYEIVEVRTKRGITRALLYPKAILQAERETDAPLREALGIKQARPEEGLPVSSTASSCSAVDRSQSSATMAPSSPAMRSCVGPAIARSTGTTSRRESRCRTLLPNPSSSRAWASARRIRHLERDAPQDPAFPRHLHRVAAPDRLITFL